MHLNSKSRYDEALAPKRSQKPSKTWSIIDKNNSKCALLFVVVVKRDLLVVFVVKKILLGATQKLFAAGYAAT